jgi:L-asparaginase II
MLSSALHAKVNHLMRYGHFIALALKDRCCTYFMEFCNIEAAYFKMPADANIGIDVLDISEQCQRCITYHPFKAAG